MSTKPFRRRSIVFLALALALPCGALHAGVTSITLERSCVATNSQVIARVRVNACKPGECTDLDLTQVTLTSSDPSAAVIPDSLSVGRAAPAEGQVIIHTRKMTSPRTVTFTASADGTSRTAQLTVYPLSHFLSSLDVLENSVLGGAPAEGVVTLICRAPPAGIALTIKSSHPEVAIPPQVTVPANENRLSFLVQTKPVLATTKVSLTVSSGGPVQEADFTILPGSLNLSLDKSHPIELTQAIQHLADPARPDNDIPLIQRKTLAARVYLDSNTPIPINNVRGTLATRPCGSSGAWTFHPLFGSSTSARGDLTLLEEREDPAARFNLNFLVDRQHLTSDCLDFQVEVNPDRFITETSYDDNSRSLPGVRFHATRNLNIKFVKIDYQPNHPFDDDPRYRPSWSTIHDMIPYVENVFPVDRVSWWKASREVNVTWFTPFKNFEKREAWSWVLGKLAVLQTLTDDEAGNMHYFGLLDDRVDHCSGGDCLTGLGNYYNLWAAGVAGDGDTAAHELAHNHNRRHAPCGDPDDVDANWPQSTNPGTEIGQTGFDLRTWQALPAAEFLDFMSYCSPKWVSPYTYRALFGDFVQGGGGGGAADVAAAPAGAGEPADHLLVTGVLAEDGSVHLEPFHHRSFATGVHDGPGEGPYFLKVMGGEGQVLFGRSFAVHRPHGEGMGGYFFEVVPFGEGAARIEIEGGASVIASRAVSASAPIVELLAPRGGESFPAGAPIAVSWSAADADGDELSFLVLYSRDGGASWEALESGIRETSMVIEEADLAGTERGRLRIVATDGINEGRDESASDFRVERKRPETAILAPTSGLSVPEGAAVLVRGAASDLEDGPIDESRMVWSSTRDGLLGTGPEAAAVLSPGIHAVRLAVTDSDGLSAEASIAITVIAEDLPAPPGLQRPGDCNQDGGLDVSDAICLFGYLFLGSPERLPCAGGTAGDEAGTALLDSSGDGRLDISDGIGLLAFTFLGGPAPVLGTECVAVPGCADACAE